MPEPKELLSFADRQAWRAWLEAHHADRDEAWLLHTKKNASVQGLAYGEAVEEALCFGWIDGVMRGINADFFALRYSPRKRNSVWSESNKARVEQLIREGRMTAAGLAKVAEAKANGQWDAASQREQVDVLPADLEQALSRYPDGLERYRGASVSRKKQWLYGIAAAKRPETRARRIDAVVRELVGGPGS